MITDAEKRSSPNLPTPRSGINVPDLGTNSGKKISEAAAL